DGWRLSAQPSLFSRNCLSAPARDETILTALFIPYIPRFVGNTGVVSGDFSVRGRASQLSSDLLSLHFLVVCFLGRATCRPHPSPTRRLPVAYPSRVVKLIVVRQRLFN